MHACSLSSSAEDLGSYHIGGKDMFGIAEFDADVASKATWTGDLHTIVGWDSADVRQGDSLTVTRHTPLQMGEPAVSGKLSGRVDDHQGGVVPAEAARHGL
jgi:hypothetical protein